MCDMYYIYIYIYMYIYIRLYPSPLQNYPPQTVLRRLAMELSKREAEEPATLADINLGYTP